jgi:hypothetical protein
MPKFYICPVIGSGTPEDPYRAAVYQDRVDHAVSQLIDGTGALIDTWCTVAVEEVSVVAKRDGNGERVTEDLQLQVRDHDTGETFIHTVKRVVPAALHHSVVKARAGVEAVADWDAGRLAIEAKKSGNVR